MEEAQTGPKNSDHRKSYISNLKSLNKLNLGKHGDKPTYKKLIFEENFSNLRRINERIYFAIDIQAGFYLADQESRTNESIGRQTAIQICVQAKVRRRQDVFPVLHCYVKRPYEIVDLSSGISMIELENKSLFLTMEEVLDYLQRNLSIK